MRLHRIFNIILSAFLGAAGLLLIAACLYVYYGVGEYSREIVGDVFSYIAVPVYIAVALVVLGFVYELVSPLKGKKEKPERDWSHYLKLLRSKKDLSEAQKSLCAAIEKEERKRKLCSVLTVVIVCLCAAAFLVYGADPGNFHQSEINESMIGAMQMMAAPLLISAAAGIFAEIFKKSSIKKEAELLKKIPDAKGRELEIKAESKAKGAVVLSVKIAVVLLAVGLLVYGAIEGGFADVMTKAVNICTECIGLG